MRKVRVIPHLLILQEFGVKLEEEYTNANHNHIIIRHLGKWTNEIKKYNINQKYNPS